MLRKKENEWESDLRQINIFFSRQFEVTTVVKLSSNIIKHAYPF